MSTSGSSKEKPSTAEITLLLRQWQAGDAGAEEKLWPILYAELDVLASAALRRGASPTLQTTELVNEACLRLLGTSDRDWPHRGHFFAFAAKVMRSILVDRARKRQTGKRGSRPGAAPFRGWNC